MHIFNGQIVANVARVERLLNRLVYGQALAILYLLGAADKASLPNHKSKSAYAVIVPFVVPHI